MAAMGAGKGATPTKVAIIGSGNIGTDLLVKALRSPLLEPVALVGIDPESDGLARARRLGVRTSHAGVAGLLTLPDVDEVRVVFDATSARAHAAHRDALLPTGAQLVDLTPAAHGPFVVPSVNLHEHVDAVDVNMVTCGGQATIPVVAAMSAVTPVPYAEVVATIASRSAGPGTRANIDEFTQTTARALTAVGGAERGKAIIVLNPAEPPVLMRDTVLALVPCSTDVDRLRTSVQSHVAAVAAYVPGYRLKRPVQVDAIDATSVGTLLPGSRAVDLLQVTVFLEVEGAADHLPAFAGNLDIMTAAAVRVGEVLVSRRPVAA